MANKKVQKGNDLMLFIKDAAGAYKSVAMATSHTLTLNLETEDIASKDHGHDGAKMPKKVTWSINSENLMILDDCKAIVDKVISTEKYFDLVFATAKINTGTETTVTGFDKTDEAEDGKYWTPNAQGGFVYHGSALCSSLTINTGAGDNASYSCTFDGSGSLVAGLPAGA